jgi:hypothetical protein
LSVFLAKHGSRFSKLMSRSLLNIARDGHGAASLPEREAMALGLDGDALDRGGHAGSG